MKESDRQLDEGRRRAQAEESRGQVVEGSGRPLAVRRLDQMVSLRLDPDVLAGLRTIADETGRSVSDLLRTAAAQLVTRHQFALTTVSITTVVSVLSSVAPLPPIAPGPNPQTFSGIVQEYAADQITGQLQAV